MKKNLIKYNYYVRLAKQTSGYKATTKFVINQSRKHMNMVLALHQIKRIEVDEHFGMETQNASQPSNDGYTKAAENGQNKIEFKSGYNAHSRQLQTVNNNKMKAYALL